MKQILLTLFFMAFFPIAMIAYDCEVGGIYYNLNTSDNTAEVSHGNYSGSVVIPSSFVYNGITYSVTSIGPSAFYYCSNLTSVTIPSSVTSIGSSAFKECSSLTSIAIPSSVTSIGEYAFYDCKNLTDVSLGDGITTIQGCAFDGCTSLTTIFMPKSITFIGGNAFSRCNNLTKVEVEDLSKWCNIYFVDGYSNPLREGHHLYLDGREVFHLVIPDGVQTLSYCAFLGCSELVSVFIPSSVTNIEYLVFSECPALESIIIDTNNSYYNDGNGSNCVIRTSSNEMNNGCKNTVIPNTVTKIRDYSYYGCTSLTDITIPSSVTSIGGSAFSYCSSLTSITVEWEEPLKVSSGIFSDVPIDQATLYVPYGTKAAYEAADVWKDFGNIVEKAPNPIITFADAKVKALCVENWDTNEDGELSMAEAAAVTDLGQVFKENKEITSFDELQFFTGLTYLGCDDGVSQPFFGCSSLTSITIPNSVTRIETWTFFGCSSLTGITIPNSVTSIESWAFQGCSGLTSIEIPHSVTSIGGGAFPDCTGLSAIKVDSGNTVYDSRGNCNAIIETATNTLNNGCKNTVIPSSVTAIGDAAFQGITNLTSIEIPDNVVSIGRQAFEHCSDLTSINIPNSVTSLGMLAFGYCYGLTSVTIPNSVELIDGNAFAYCPGLNSINVDSENAVYDSRGNCNAVIETATNKLVVGCKNTIIPSNITIIGSGAFTECSDLTSITIPNTVTSIEDGAFYWCTGLTSITIPSSVTSIGGGAFYGCSSLTSITVEWEQPLAIIENGEFGGLSLDQLTLYVPFGTKDAYEATDVWKDFGNIVEKVPANPQITITSAGMATYCSPYDLDFTNVAGLKAYIITGYDWINKRVYAMRVFDVPAGTGLYLVGKPGDYTIEIGSTGSYYVANMLVGTLAETTINPTDGDLTNLRLTGSSPQDASFKTFTVPRTFSANRAYLQIPTAVLNNSANAVGIVFDDEVDGINGISQNAGDTESAWFTLDGRKLSGKPTTKGVYVVNGRKVVVR